MTSQGPSVSNTTIGPPTFIEIPTLASIAKQTSRETYPNYFSEDDLEELFGDDFITSKVPSELTDRNCLYLTMKYNGIMIAYAKLIFRDTSTFLDKLYLLKEYQGKKLGFLLLNACHEEAIKQGAKQIQLRVWTKNENAVKFYERNRYIADGLLYPYRNVDNTLSEEFDYLMIRSLP